MKTPRFAVVGGLAALLLLAPVAAIAQNGTGKMLQTAKNQLHAKFVAADKDKDGYLSKDEVAKADLPRVAKHFDEIDTTHRGKVSEKEIQVFTLQRMKAAHDAKAAAGT